MCYYHGKTEAIKVWRYVVLNSGVPNWSALMWCTSPQAFGSNTVDAFWTSHWKIIFCWLSVAFVTTNQSRLQQYSIMRDAREGPWPLVFLPYKFRMVCWWRREHDLWWRQAGLFKKDDFLYVWLKINFVQLNLSVACFLAPENCQRIVLVEWIVGRCNVPELFTSQC